VGVLPVRDVERRGAAFHLASQELAARYAPRLVPRPGPWGQHVQEITSASLFSIFFRHRRKPTYRTRQFRLIPNKSPKLAVSSLTSMGQPTPSTQS
jgi:hypothetical protein